MNKQFLLLFILLSAFSLLSISQHKTKDANERLIAKIDSILQSQVDADKIPGAVIQIRKAGKVIYKNAYGYAQKYDVNHQLLAAPEKMTTEHLFDIASLTKVVGTTTSIMLLVDKGLLKAKSPFAICSRILQDFMNGTRYTIVAEIKMRLTN